MREILRCYVLIYIVWGKKKFKNKGLYYLRLFLVVYFCLSLFLFNVNFKFEIKIIYLLYGKIIIIKKEDFGLLVLMVLFFYKNVFLIFRLKFNRG